VVCRCITSKSGDVTKETQSSFTDDVGDVDQARTTQNFIVRHEIVPADVQHASSHSQKRCKLELPNYHLRLPGTVGTVKLVHKFEGGHLERGR